MVARRVSPVDEVEWFHLVGNPALNAFAITFGDRMPKAENH